MHVSDPCIALTMCQVLFLELYKYFNSLKQPCGRLNGNPPKDKPKS